MSKKEKEGITSAIAGVGVLILSSIVSGTKAIVDVISNNATTVGVILLVVLSLTCIGIAFKLVVETQRKKLMEKVLDTLRLDERELELKPYDEEIVVKSRQSLDNYSTAKFLKDTGSFEEIRTIVEGREEIIDDIYEFLDDNDYMDEAQYKYVKQQLIDYAKRIDGYRVSVVYVTSAGNTRGSKSLYLDPATIQYYTEHPEDLMSKSEYNKMIKQQNQEALEEEKHDLYDHVNEIIDYANKVRDKMLVKSRTEEIDVLVQKLLDNTISNIQKIKKVDSDERELIENVISSTDSQIRKIVRDDTKLRNYYKSEDFAKIQETCRLLTQSQKEFNEYITEKAHKISELFGTRVVRNETQHEDTNNYIRAYKKSITPFTAEVSAAVFSSAENDPIGYIVKYFYPNKSDYPKQIENLKVLTEELETLKEAKVIIDNYKKDYAQYISNVPRFVLDTDEDGFYSRLGFAVLDDAVLNVEYKFTYTSGGGMAQRSFTVPMSEENIAELVKRLENKLTLAEMTKEQRALMTSKLRQKIKERDNYTCCLCKNSIFAEPNLLLEIDHIIPVSKGGLTEESNLQTLCWKCNRHKGASMSV